MYTLILVDDEPFALNYLSSLIDWQSYNFELVQTFTDGSTAIDFIEQNHPDLVITDIKMPNVSGIDIAKYCFEYSSQTRVVFISAYKDFEYAQKALSYRVSEYIEKPLKKQKITDILKSFSFSSNSVFAIANNEEDKLQWLFADLIYGVIKNENELASKFSESGLNSDDIYKPCAIFNLHIADFGNYIKTVWRYNTDNLYRAISYVITSVNREYRFYIVRHSYNNIEIIAVSMLDNNDEAILSDLIFNCIAELLELFKLDCKITNTIYYDKITDIINKASLLAIDDFTHSNKIVNSVYEYIQDNYTKSISSKDAANHVMLSNAYFCSFYKKHAGETFIDTLNKYRIKKASEILLSDESIKPSAMYKMVGFFNQGYFYKTFKQYTGLTPAEFKKKNQ